jgi:Heterokaryon incompatibility protein (HET)
MESKTCWELSIRASLEQRKAAHRSCKLRVIPHSLCATCRAIDFEYFFFGDAATGQRRHHYEALCLGSLPAVIARSKKGCKLCTSIILKQAEDTFDMRALCKSESWMVYSTAAHHGFARDAPTTQRSEGLYVALQQKRPGDSDLPNTKDVIDEWDEQVISHSSASFLCLVDHELSAYKVVQPLVKLNSCKSWLERCFSAHDRCRNDLGALTQDGTTRSNRHFKLIDVETRHIVQIGGNSLVRYATLSYVWGNPLSICIIPKNSREWELDEAGYEKYPLPASLSQTLLDAVIVTAGLGLQYLWIDSLCITQDDPVEKQVQIEAMSDIYWNATICIIAASGVDSTAGLPGISLSRSILQGCETSIREGVSVGIPHAPLRHIIGQSRWLGRA